MALVSLRLFNEVSIFISSVRWSKFGLHFSPSRWHFSKCYFNWPLQLTLTKERCACALKKKAIDSYSKMILFDANSNGFVLTKWKNLIIPTRWIRYNMYAHNESDMNSRKEQIVCGIFICFFISLSFHLPFNSIQQHEYVPCYCCCRFFSQLTVNYAIRFHVFILRTPFLCHQLCVCVFVFMLPYERVDACFISVEFSEYFHMIKGFFFVFCCLTSSNWVIMERQLAW